MKRLGPRSSPVERVKLKTVEVCQGGRIPLTEGAAYKKEPGEGLFSSAQTRTDSVSLASGNAMIMDKEGPRFWRTFSACGHLENGSLGIPRYHHLIPTSTSSL